MPDVQIITAPPAELRPAHKQSSEIIASRGLVEQKCEQFSCGKRVGKLTGIKTNPGDATAKYRSQCLRGWVCVRIHLCDTVFIYSSPLGEQHHYWCKGRKSGGIRVEVTLGKVPYSLQAA